MNVLVHTDHFFGEIRLSSGGPFGYPINALVLRTDDDEMFRPSDIIPTEGRNVVAAVMVYEWALREERTEAEVNAARRYLCQWPIGPQIE